MKYLKHYSTQRLLREHVPYAIEAWPEGNQRHLAAESGLYCRIITEGLFGIRPVGLHSFTLMPSLPKNWNKMSLKKIRAFGNNFDLNVSRKGKKIKIDVIVVQ
jgi:cellobiose phosphorylase